MLLVAVIMVFSLETTSKCIRGIVSSRMKNALRKWELEFFARFFFPKCYYCEKTFCTYDNFHQINSH